MILQSNNITGRWGRYINACRFCYWFILLTISSSVGQQTRRYFASCYIFTDWEVFLTLLLSCKKLTHFLSLILHLVVSTDDLFYEASENPFAATPLRKNTLSTNPWSFITNNFTYHTFLGWIIEYESQRQNSFRANYLQWRNAFQRCKLQRYEPSKLKMFK